MFHIEVVAQRLQTFLSKSVPIAIVSERLDDGVHSEVREVSLPKQRLDNLRRLSKKSSLVEAWPMAKLPLTFSRQ